ncbi:MAG: hypothetical protein KDK90_27565, partial [Leptospiraceae bacterium]|nr:hypothetical protein [Leptospiraceae bacterium]
DFCLAVKYRGFLGIGFNRKNGLSYIKNQTIFYSTMERWNFYKSIWQNHWSDFLPIYNKDFIAKLEY